MGEATLLGDAAAYVVFVAAVIELRWNVLAEAQGARAEGALRCDAVSAFLAVIEFRYKLLLEAEMVRAEGGPDALI